MSTMNKARSELWNGYPLIRDASTRQILHAQTPLVFHEDFLGTGLWDGTTKWAVVDVGAATEAVVADSAGGVFKLTLTAADEAQDAVLCFGDQRNFNTNAPGLFQCRLTMSVVPGTGVACVFGMAGDHNLDKDAVTEAAWFRLQASAALLLETDDTTNNEDDTATGVTLVAAAYHIFEIDFTTQADVKFYMDGTRLAAATTFDMSNLSASEAIMQPYFSLDKASGTGLGSISVDDVWFLGAAR